MQKLREFPLPNLSLGVVFYLALNTGREKPGDGGHFLHLCDPWSTMKYGYNGNV